MTATETKERPIPFSSPMLQAIKDRLKTQTRRVVTRVAGFGPVREFGQSDTPGYDWTFRCKRGLWQDFRHDDLLSRCPYGKPGDHLWVRSKCWLDRPDVSFPRRAFFDDGCVIFSDGKPTALSPTTTCSYHWTPKLRAEYYSTVGCLKPTSSIHMPRWASPALLLITDVRIERLQEMTYLDWASDFAPSPEQKRLALKSFVGKDNQVKMAKEFWDSFNTKRGYGWDANPWVWVILFKLLKVT